MPPPYGGPQLSIVVHKLYCTLELQLISVVNLFSLKKKNQQNWKLVQELDVLCMERMLNNTHNTKEHFGVNFVFCKDSANDSILVLYQQTG